MSTNQRGYVPRPQATEIPTAAWNDTPLYCLRVNDAWVSHVLGVLAALDQPDTWIGTADEIDAARQQVNEIMLALMTQCEDTMTDYPQHATLWHYQARIVAGGAMTNISLADAPYNLTDGFFNLLSYQSTFADADSFEQPVLLAAGDYDFYALGGKNQYGGWLNWYLDDDLFWEAEDFYNAAVQINVIEHTTLTIPTDGHHILRGVVNGHNASSAAYFIPLINYWFDLTP